MIVIKWNKIDKDDFDLGYELDIYNDNKPIEIGFIWWCEEKECWFLHFDDPIIKGFVRQYNQYNKTEINDVLFRAVLDIQNELSKINNTCVDYCNAISDYAIDYVQGINHNED